MFYQYRTPSGLGLGAINGLLAFSRSELCRGRLFVCSNSNETHSRETVCHRDRENERKRVLKNGAGKQYKRDEAMGWKMV